MKTEKWGWKYFKERMRKDGWERNKENGRGKEGWEKKIMRKEGCKRKNEKERFRKKEWEIKDEKERKRKEGLKRKKWGR